MDRKKYMSVATALALTAGISMQLVWAESAFAEAGEKAAQATTANVINAVVKNVNLAEHEAIYPQKYYQVGSASLSAEQLQTWWTLFNDAELNHLVELSLNGSKDIEMARSRMLEARAQLGISKSELSPTVGADASYARKGYSDNTPVQGMRGLIYNDYNLGLDASWELDFWGKNLNKVKASQLEIKAREAELYGAQVSITGEVAINYFTLRSTQQRIKCLKEQLSRQEERLNLLRINFQVGMIGELAVKQAEYNLERNRSQLPALRQQEAQCLNILAILTGKLPGELDAELSDTDGSAKLPDIDARNLNAIPADSIMCRPDITAAEARFMAQVKRTDAAKKDWLPSISFSGTFGFESYNSGSLLSPESRGFSLLPAIHLPLFNGGAIRNNVNYNKEREGELYAAYENTILQGVADVRNALTGVQQEYERGNELAAGKRSADEALDLAMISYKNGLTDYRAVLDAQNNAVDMEMGCIESNGRELMNLVKLFKALGGGWNIRE